MVQIYNIRKEKGHSRRRAIKDILECKLRDYKEVYLSTGNSVRNQWHRRTTWTYFSYKFEIYKNIYTAATCHNRWIHHRYLPKMLCKFNIAIPSILKRYVVHWYYTYLLHLGILRMKAMIGEYLYWPDITDAVRN